LGEGRDVRENPFGKIDGTGAVHKIESINFHEPEKRKASLKRGGPRAGGGAIWGKKRPRKRGSLEDGGETSARKTRKEGQGTLSGKKIRFGV